VLHPAVLLLLLAVLADLMTVIALLPVALADPQSYLGSLEATYRGWFADLTTVLVLRLTLIVLLRAGFANAQSRPVRH